MHDARQHPPAGASGLLLLAAAIWGFAFVAQRSGMAHVGPFFFNGVRFLLGTLVLIPFLLRSPRPAECARTRGQGRTVLGLIGSGLVLTVAANLQQIGLVSTSAGKAGFLTGLYVVLVPLLGLARGQRLRWVTALAVPLSSLGLYFLSIVGSLRLAPGDGWVLLGALAWAVHVHVIDWLVARAEALVIALVQFSICGALSLTASLFLEATTWDGVAASWVAIAYAGVLSVGVAYTLQVMGQRRVGPAVAGVVLSLEGVFAALGGWLLLGERLSARSLAGGGLMLAAMVLSQFAASPGERRRRVAGRPASR
ncbi:MAG: DMT family transporter [Candidatus Bipolaricaulota bacterium]